MSTLADQKKIILPYLQRADEIQSLNPKVAYYCRLHAIEQGLQLPSRAPEIQGVLEALMEKLEKDKPSIGMSDDDAHVCEAFAVKVFNLADTQDRAGDADAKTVRAFYAASIFIDVLEHFGELPPDMVERKQYAFWKAADIRKALREGRKPEPGPPGKDELDLDLPDTPAVGPQTVLSGESSASLPVLPAGLPTLAQQPSGSLPLQQSGALPQPRFRPGSKVYFNSSGGPPEKGTVVTATSGPTGTKYQVGLSRQVVEAPEGQLAHDYAAGDKVLFTNAKGPTLEATIDRLDASRWPVAYLLTLPDGASLPTAENALVPAVSESAPPPPMATARSPSVSPTKSRGSLGARNEYRPLAGASAQSDAPGLDEGAVQGSTALPPPDGDIQSFEQPGTPQDESSGRQPSGTLGSSAFTPLPGVVQQHLPPQNTDGLHGAPADEPEYPDFGSISHTSPQPSLGQPVIPPPQTPAAPQIQAASSQRHEAALSAATPGYHPPLAAITEAQKMAKYAVSSLSFEDVPTAIKNLHKALELLTVAKQ